jgi:hypothetical protein
MREKERETERRDERWSEIEKRAMGQESGRERQTVRNRLR